MIELIALGVAVVVALLKVVAFFVAAWLLSVAMEGLISFIKKIRTRIAVVRKGKSLGKFVDAARKSGNYEIANELEQIEKNSYALLTPVNQNGNEEWEKLKVVGANDAGKSDMIDAFIFADTGRVSPLR